LPRPTVIARTLAIASLAAASVVGIGCGSSDDKSVTKVSGPPRTVTVALDWTPNTNHMGAYVAQALGYYKEAGLNVKFLPYASTPPETLVANGKADFGFSYQAGVAYARASGQDVVQVMATIRKPQYAIGYRADRNDIKSPKDLDGKVYAGFGLPDEKPGIEFVIKKDGGKGNFKVVTLNTSAYEAVYAGSADFTLPSTTWEGVEASLTGKPLKYFNYTDYGFPESYSTALISSNAYLKANADTAQAFLAATKRGYEYAQQNPAKAAALLIKQNPQAFKNTQLVEKSAEMLTKGDFYGDPATIGQIDGQVWTDYGKFLFANKLLIGANGKPLTAEPDWATYWTNEYLPKD